MWGPAAPPTDAGEARTALDHVSDDRDGVDRHTCTYGWDFRPGL